jgi:hypothetical protein
MKFDDLSPLERWMVRELHELIHENNIELKDIGSLNNLWENKVITEEKRELYREVSSDPELLHKIIEIRR